MPEVRSKNGKEKKDWKKKNKWGETHWSEKMACLQLPPVPPAPSERLQGSTAGDVWGFLQLGILPLRETLSAPRRSLTLPCRQLRTGQCATGFSRKSSGFHGVRFLVAVAGEVS